MWLNQVCVNRCAVFGFFFEKKAKALHDVKGMLCVLPGLCHLPGSLNSSFLAAPWEKWGRSRIEVRVCVCVCMCVCVCVREMLA